jgi:hypothetical protein
MGVVLVEVSVPSLLSDCEAMGIGVSDAHNAGISCEFGNDAERGVDSLLIATLAGSVPKVVGDVTLVGCGGLMVWVLDVEEVFVEAGGELVVVPTDALCDDPP